MPEGHLVNRVWVCPWELNDSDEIRDKFFNIIIDRIENNIGESIKNNIVFQRSYAHRDFTKDFNTMNGNAYGLANTLMQSAFLKPISGPKMYFRFLT